MIKVFEDFDYSRVGQLQSLLEANGIRTFLKNQFGFGGTGELPFVETVPQLYILEEDDLARARELLKDELAGAPTGEPWICPTCGTEIEGCFSACWQCSGSDENP
jgi:hypothetical protein